MDGKEKKLDQFEIEAKTSGGAVFELGVKTSKHDKAVRRMAQPLMDKLGVNGTIRASFYLYNDDSDAEIFLAGIDRVLEAMA